MKLERQRRITRRVLPMSVLGLALLSGCGPLTDALLDCIDDDGPVLSPRTIPNPVLNESYEVRVNASIENEPLDDSFDYDIVVSDTLPEGLTAFVFERQVRITGAATQLGSFTFDISVAIEDPDNFGFGFNNSFDNNFNNVNDNFNNNDFNNVQSNTSGLCRTTTQRTYQLTVQQSS